jgi:hypothetical protein
LAEMGKTVVVGAGTAARRQSVVATEGRGRVA